MHEIKKHLRILAPLAWMAVIFYLSHQQAESSDEQSGAIFNLIKPFAGGVDEDLLIFIIRKTAHFLSYLLLGILLYWAALPYAKTQKNTAATSVAVALLFAASDELHQHFIPGRSSELRDVLIDTLGALTGVLIATLVTLHLHKRHTIINSNKTSGPQGTTHE